MVDSLQLVAVGILGALVGALVTYQVMTRPRCGPKERLFMFRTTVGVLLFCAVWVVLCETIIPPVSWPRWAWPLYVVGIFVVAGILRRAQAAIRRKEQQETAQPEN